LNSMSEDFLKMALTLMGYRSVKSHLSGVMGAVSVLLYV